MNELLKEKSVLDNDQKYRNQTNITQRSIYKHVLQKTLALFNNLKYNHK